MGIGLYEGIHAEDRFVMGDDGRVQKKLVDVTNETGRVAFLDPEKVFETERAAREHAAEVCASLGAKFKALAEEHYGWLNAHPVFAVGDRVKDDDGDAATIIGFTKDGHRAALEYDNRSFGVMDQEVSDLTKIED